MHTLLHLDFETREAATKSSRKWINEIGTISGNVAFAGVAVSGSLKQTSPTTNGVVDSGSNATNDLTGMIRKKRKVHADAAPVIETRNQQPAVNILAAGMIRKKPKPA